MHLKMKNVEVDLKITNHYIRTREQRKPTV